MTERTRDRILPNTLQRVSGRGADADLWKSIGLTAAILLPLAAFTISRGIRPHGREVQPPEQLEAGRAS